MLPRLFGFDRLGVGSLWIGSLGIRIFGVRIFGRFGGQRRGRGRRGRRSGGCSHRRGRAVGRRLSLRRVVSRHLDQWGGMSRG